MLEDIGSDSLVYIPSHMLMPQELKITHKKGHNSQEIASLTSGKETKSYDGIFK